jgi:hypothetical protein
MFHPVIVDVDWAELPEGMSEGGADSLRDMGQQVETWSVDHSLDDGMPDSVTMTNGNDASGSLETSLAGRPANVADILTGWRAGTTSGSGSGTSITVTLPGDVEAHDYVMVAIMVSNQSGVYEANFEEGDPHGWSLLAESTDSTFTTYVFGRHHWVASPAPDFRIRTTGSWSWCVGTIGAHYTIRNSSIVPVAPGEVTTDIETVTQTGHTGPYAALPSRGYLLGVFATANASGPWTVASGGTELVESTGGVGAVQMVKANLTTLPGDYRFVSNTVGSTGVAMMFNVPLLIMDRPQMDAVGYFSQFDNRSPVRDFERDTALVGAEVQVVSPTGIVATPVFDGQMADIVLTGRAATMHAVSRTRLLLDKAISLPTVFGRREGCTTDWVATYVMAHGGQYPGIAPSPQTRYWATMHGSLHANMDGGNGYNTQVFWDDTRTPTGPWGQGPPGIVEGPFVLGMFGQSTDARVDDLWLQADRANWSREVPGMEAENNDLISSQNSTCRLTFWIRGDATDKNPDALDGGTDTLFVFELRCQYNDVDSNYIACKIDNDRRPQLFLENGFFLTGGDLPADGEWHFYGFVWNYDTGAGRVRRDNVTWEITGYDSAAHGMATSEEALNAAGRHVRMDVSSRMPIAELQLEAGPNLYSEQFTRFYPTPAAPSLNATYRPTQQWVEAVANTAPRQGWGILQELAEATVMSLRVNEADNAEMVPLEYYGQGDMMVVEAYNVLDTEVNAGELGVVNDPTKTRNFVTVEFQETRTDSNRTSVLDMTSALRIPPGLNFMTFALELPAAEIHGAIDPYLGANWNLTKLTALQVAGTNALPNDNFMSVNPREDGLGTVYTSGGVVARIVEWSSSTVTVRFTNTTGSSYWLSNSGSDVPFMRILGYPIRQAAAYESFRDSGSVAKRRERALTVQDPWIQNRTTATDHAGRIVTVASRPRAEITVTVMGDPRRHPGQLAEINDSEGTGAEGTWRIHSVTSQGAGPMYRQTVKMFRVGPVLLWGEGRWGQGVWGE